MLDSVIHKFLAAKQLFGCRVQRSKTANTRGHQLQHFLVKFTPIYTITTYLSTILHLFLISFMFHVQTSQNVSPSNSVFISHSLHPSYRSTEHVTTIISHKIPNHVITQNVYLLHHTCEYRNYYYCFECLTNQRINVP
jgi:hypothetical protein